jgi:cell division protein FtsI (penicillin-binding protein 3)
MTPNKRLPRMTIVLVVLQFGFGLLIARLFFVQFLHSEAYVKRPKKQHTQNQTQSKRGKIFDRHLSVLALNQELVSVYADPQFINTDPYKIARQLSPLLQISVSQLLSKLHQTDRQFVWLKRNLPYEQLSTIRPVIAKFRGVKYQIDGKRSYPKANLACHIIGYTNYADEGKEGIERQYNAHLLNKGRKRIPGETQERQGDKNNIILTIDEYIQYLTEQELIEGCKKWKAKKGAAIVMHTKTGQILAMANYPNYDLNRYSKSREAAKRNQSIWMQYEPGSVFKIVAASAVINEKIMTPESGAYCEMGEYRLPNGHVLHDIKPNGWLTLSEILQKSSNIGITKVASRLGRQRLDKYIRRFGFGQETGIDLPYEQSGNLRALKRWDDYSLASVPFGQGISVTPLQMLNAMNTIATGGVLVRPTITLPKTKRARPKPFLRVISPIVAEQMTDILVAVTERGGAKNARVKGYRVAGKTGTAQKAEKGKGYVPGKVTTTFAGFLPAEEPQISIIVVVDEPEGGPLSSEVTVPIFQRIAERTMQYLNRQGFLESPAVQFTSYGQ